MTEPTTTVRIWRLYAEGKQGEIETVLEDVSTYKWAPRNGFEQYVEAEHPDEGIYVAASEDGKLSLWKLRYPAYTYQSYSADQGRPVGQIRQVNSTPNQEG